MFGIEEEFFVAFRAKNGTLHDVAGEPKLAHSVGHALAGCLVEIRFPNDTAFTYLSLSHFKLRFDQYNHSPVRL